MVKGYTNRICEVGLPPTSPMEEIKIFRRAQEAGSEIRIIVP